ncbi:MAG: hypothetical protein ACUVSQ_12750 [Pseudanabaenaceae cyanobacterium]
MAPNNLLELARQGNVKVIAALLNRLLKSQSMLVAVSRSDRLLEVEIETDRREGERIRVPNREVLTTTLQKWLLTIGVNVPRLRVSWRPAGSESATWVQECDLMPDRSEQDVLEEVARTTDLTALDRPKASDDLLADLNADLTGDFTENVHRAGDATVPVAPHEPLPERGETTEVPGDLNAFIDTSAAREFRQQMASPYDYTALPDEPIAPPFQWSVLLTNLGRAIVLLLAAYGLYSLILPLVAPSAPPPPPPASNPQ